MLCKRCEKERRIKDFYKSDVCYKCVYEKKISLFSKYVIKFKLCKICKSKVPSHKDVYCSDECAKEGKSRKDKEYWIRKCLAPKVNWKT